MSRYQNWANKLGRYAQQAVLYEAVLEPKPGLVDSIDNGSHKDMDIFTFIDSASSLYSGFVEFAMNGFNHTGDARSLFTKIRKTGIEIEKNMFKVTNGINTHKGIIFSMGIVISAVAFSLKNYQKTTVKELPVLKPTEVEIVFSTIQKMTEGLVSKDFSALETKEILTNGEKLYIEFGFLGIRGEAEAGFPTVKNVLPKLRKGSFRKPAHSTKDIYLDILFILMSDVQDSTVVSRGGIEALEYVKQTARIFLENGGMQQHNAIEKIININERFRERWISPGGSADLLAITILFIKLENINLGG
ncbi:triphosphoribosyl-dephospho-CoA synthase CitG [Marinilactibacillus sp. 15R]|nr:triphosphoribosyl-dephospho-CoA synthase CitG [Marinilactibacillus sp. 15R]